MHWGQPLALLLLLLVPVFLVTVGFVGRSRRRAFQRLAEPRFFDFFHTEYNGFLWNLRAVLLTLAYAFLVLALARPQWNRVEIEDLATDTLIENPQKQTLDVAHREGIDIVIALDVSLSMEAQSGGLARIKQAKWQIGSFLDSLYAGSLSDDQVALVTFAGRSTIQFPLTGDPEVAKLFIDDVDTEIVSSSASGTDIGMALAMSDSLLQSSTRKKMILLISDGEDLEDNALPVVERIARHTDVKIFALGVGSEQASRIPIRDARGNLRYATDDEGNFVFTRLHPETLARIAALGGGRYFQSTLRRSEIGELMEEIREMKKGGEGREETIEFEEKIKSEKHYRYEDKYHYPLAVALALLLLEATVAWRRRQRFPRVLS
ncbi:MAG: VWA domain-containing protein [Candidatus Cloacimonetes bacterium]|nr:VWA domain-containing protein [Candidatus Cloacimonadota bacterium]